MWAARYGATIPERGTRIRLGLPVRAVNGLPQPLPGLLRTPHQVGGIPYLGHLEFPFAPNQRFVLSQRFTETHPQWQEQRAYRVMYNNHVALSCSCPDHVQRTRVCKHMYAVQLDLNRRLGQPANQRTVQTRSRP